MTSIRGRTRRRATLAAGSLLLASLLTAAPAHAAPTRYEAENATISQGVIEANHLNYSGTGFVNTDNVVGSYVQWTATAADAGPAVLKIRYANGTAVDRPADITVNGFLVAGGVSFAGTGNWDTWATKTLAFTANAGANTVRVASTSVNGTANLDYIETEVEAASTDYQAESATLSQAAAATNHTGYTGTGFVDYTNVAGGYVEFTVSKLVAGTAKLTLRYANGTGADRPLDLAVNGNTAASDLSFPATANWDTWADQTISVSLPAGTSKVRATATGASGGPNLDRLRVASQSDSTAPTTPGQPSCANIADTALDLSWGASTDDTGVIAYDVYHDGNKLTSAAAPAVGTRLTGLSPNTEYRLSVFARDAAGNTSLSSAQAICTTLASSDAQAPTVPGTPAASGVTGTGATLSWGASTDNIGVTAYDVRIGTTVVKSVTGTPPATSAAVTGLACNTAYTLNVVARDAGGNVSAASPTVSFTTTACSGGVPSAIGTLSTGWTIPWGTWFMPDGQTALVTERDDKVTAGQFKVFKVTLAGARTQVGTVPNVVTTNGEGGLLGVAADPNWATNHFIYLMHTASEGNRIARMTYNGTSLSGYTVLVQGIAKNRYHNGGRLAFGPDGYLYATTGDAQTSNLAQDKNSLNGKVLRMRTDGTPAPGNPFGTLVYSYGHRNPQGLAWDSQGRLWEAEFGNSLYDELNLIKPGLNYGWPTCEGTCSVAGMENPKRQWSVDTASPSGIAIVRDTVYMAALRGERMWRIPLLSGESTGTPTAYYVGTYGRLRTVTKVPGADQLWLSTTNSDNNGGAANGSDTIFKITIS
ncbi:glucose dehydrogenase [Catellatospora sp. TT07R-123]|uniref:PQQ-dependent sugar dehydrogenase n=1 Tax=Catellatospora sp. TT07R-123 TaxID=2733863 RepID=UPI001B1C8620|nr:PQQ-dependent sugar dehydrogenase [Catellatospora sp. TT07R-123]GHJ44163.1 glucose dehydrogenase [Catellatospora sp. TT07R-123]